MPGLKWSTTVYIQTLFFFGADERLQFIEFSYLRNFFWLVGIGQKLTDLLDPVDDSRMMYPCDTFDTPKTHAVDVHFEAVFSDLIAIAKLCLRIFDELTATLYTDVILLVSSVTIFSDVTRLTLWTFHRWVIAELSS